MNSTNIRQALENLADKARALLATEAVQLVKDEGDWKSEKFKQRTKELHEAIDDGYRALLLSGPNWANAEPTVSGYYYVYQLGQADDPICAYVDVEHDNIEYPGSDVWETITENAVLKTVYWYGPLPVPPITDEMKAAAEELANRPGER